jgi:hypothetical protein
LLILQFGGFLPPGFFHGTGKFREPAGWKACPTNKKAPTHKEKGRQNGCALLIFPKPMMLELELAPVTGT